MNNTVIKIEHLSKEYRLGVISHRTLYRDLQSGLSRLMNKEDPNTVIGTDYGKTVNGIFRALNDISLEIKQGDILGIIGKNGAGKSTLLKILSRVTAPTSGQVKIRGRILSLLEVGTGFHPELTGRENIFLNGAILGMRKKEIETRFDEIVDFSGVEEFIDTPVKRYSSGMYVRLAFAVAAHLESEILIVDEVLAVGDGEFQKKCLGKMEDVSKGQGRTVLFVSHNMAAVKVLCNNAILLDSGQISYQGKTNDVLKYYLSKPSSIKSSIDLVNDSRIRRGDGEVRFTEIIINNGEAMLDPTGEIRIRCKAKVFKQIDHLYFALSIQGQDASESIASTGLVCITENELSIGREIEMDFVIQANLFRTGLFPLYFWLGKKVEFAKEAYAFDVIESLYYLNLNSDKSMEELGYNSEEPSAYINLNFWEKKVNIN